MEVRLYRPPTADNLRFIPVRVTNDVTQVRYTENFFTYGDFEIAIPTDSDGAADFRKYMFVLINRAYWGIVLSVERTLDNSGDMLTVTGLCLKGLTYARNTLPPTFTYEEVGGVAGFDVVDGTTEYCMKHFIRSNFFTQASPTRAIPGFVIAPDKGRGLPDDKYMTRFDQLSLVLEELGRAAGIGYTILPDLDDGNIVFDCVEGVDRSAEQSNNPRIIFSPERKNIVSMNYQNNDRNMRNLFYATLAGAQFEDEAYTATFTRGDEPLPSGMYRWEQHLDISATHPEPGRELDELKRLAMVRAESYVTVESFTAEILNAPKVYGVDYKLGDIVTVQNRNWQITQNVRLVSMTVDASSSGITYTATFGDAPINFVARLRRQIRGG